MPRRESLGVSGELHLSLAGDSVREEGAARRVTTPAEVEAAFEGLLRGYRRRYGLRLDPRTHREVPGGTGALEVRLVADAALPLSRLRALLGSPLGYSGWASQLALVARAGDSEVLVPFALRAAGGTVHLSARATIQDLAHALEANETQTPMTVTIEPP